MNRTFDLLWLRIREYFKHPAEDIRQADPIVPGRLYENFGYICKAVRYRPHEQAAVDGDKAAGYDGLQPDVLLELVRNKGIRDRESIGAIQREADTWQDTPASCRMCDFRRAAIPCPLYNRLADGTTVCDTHKYVILKKPR